MISSSPSFSRMAPIWSGNTAMKGRSPRLSGSSRLRSNALRSRSMIWKKTERRCFQVGSSARMPASESNRCVCSSTKPSQADCAGLGIGKAVINSPRAKSGVDEEVANRRDLVLRHQRRSMPYAGEFHQFRAWSARRHLVRDGCRQQVAVAAAQQKGRTSDSVVDRPEIDILDGSSPQGGAYGGIVPELQLPVRLNARLMFRQPAPLLVGDGGIAG